MSDKVHGNKGRIPWNKEKTGLQKHTEKTKRKMSAAHKGRKFSEETRKKFSETRKKTWRPFDEARKVVRSLKLSGTKEWEEYRKSNKKPNDIPANPNVIYKNDGWKGYPDWLGNEDRVHGNKGRKKSEEHRRKMSKALKGNKNFLGKTHSKETKRKIGEASKGRKKSEESKRKMSDSGIIAQNRSEVIKRRIEVSNRPEQREKLSKQRVNQKLPVKDTKPEITLQKICKDAGIEFITQKTIKLQHYDWHKTRRHQVDLFIEPNVCILADGDYWHANPNPYRKSSVRWHAGIKPDTVLVASSKQKKVAKDIRWKDAGITGLYSPSILGKRFVI